MFAREQIFFFMSFVISDTVSTVFSNPVAVPFAPENTSTTATPISTSNTAGTQLGGGTTYTLAPISTGTGNLVVSGPGTVVNLNSGAVNASIIGGGNILEATVIAGAGSSKLIEISSSPESGYNNAVVVNPSASLASGGTVSSAAGGLIPTTTSGNGQTNPGFAFYAHAGAGNDQIEGSAQNDFIRGGSGNDNINGFGGNDVIRGGSGSDTIYGGDGNDTLYYTSDQLDGATDTFTDFKTGDIIAVASTSVASTAGMTGFGSNTITFTASGTKVISSNGTLININDIKFV